MAWILAVDDEEGIRNLIQNALEKDGHRVSVCKNTEVIKEKDLIHYDLILLDIMMPGMSGLRTCEEIRKVSNVPVLFLTAKAQESDKLIGLMAGGDDYLPKPFSYAELLGRNDRVQESADEYLEIGNIRIHKEYNEIYVSGEQKELSNIEYRILLLMMQHPGRIFSAQNLYESVWEEPYFYSCNGTVMVHIRKLRVKIEKDPRNPKHIQTVWGKGYRFDGIGE